MTPQTGNPDEASVWFTRYEGAGLDGVVAKDPVGHVPARRAEAGSRSSTCGRSTAWSAAIASPRTARASGRCSSVCTAPTVRCTTSATPRPSTRPSGAPSSSSCSRSSAARASDTDGPPADRAAGRARPRRSWTSVSPELVCEVSFDHLQSGRFRHASRFLRWRPDKAPRDCDFDQLSPPEAFALEDILVTPRS